MTARKIFLLIAALFMAVSFSCRAEEMTVTFGTYPQTYFGRDKTPIEWLVLERDGDKALLVSRYLLDVMPWHPERTSSRWEASDVRQWLNGAFLDAAFTEAERAAILETDVDNSWRSTHGRECVDGGEDTKDSVFLLSYQEVNRYFPGKKDRICSLTPYTALKLYSLPMAALMTGERGTGTWWLRSPAPASCTVFIVNGDGSWTYGYVMYEGVCVRPALWVDLKDSPTG